jgi:16S rRNA (cytidine1402-2'-O)-methyltransferase
LAAVAAERRTVVLYEAPHRLSRTLADLEEVCGPSRRVAVARELTKLHEELWRGTLAAAIARSAEVEPRGEHVLVLDGAPAPVVADDDAIRAALAEQRAGGATTRDAVSNVAAALDVPKRRVYDLAVSG